MLNCYIRREMVVAMGSDGSAACCQRRQQRTVCNFWILGAVQVVREKYKVEQITSHITKLARSHPSFSFFPLVIPSAIEQKKAK
jgi:hypothetical protein